MSRRTGFTLIEILLVTAALAIIAGSVILAINPKRQLAETRNNQRRVDVATLWNAFQQYALTNHGQVPDSISVGTLDDCLQNSLSEEYTICKTSACQVVLTEFLENGDYLLNIPVGPSVTDENYSGYNVVKDQDHAYRVTVCAPASEEGVSIYLPQ